MSKKTELILNSILVVHFLVVFMWYGLAFFFEEGAAENEAFAHFQYFNMVRVVV